MCIHRTMAVLAQFSLCLFSFEAAANSIFSYAQINIPFEVKVEGSWAQVIESQEEWESFYTAHVVSFSESESELESPPKIDFNNYTIIAGGLGGGSATRSLMIERVGDSGPITYIQALILRGVGCIVPAVATFPTIAILVPKTEDELQFFVKEATYKCGDLG